MIFEARPGESGTAVRWLQDRDSTEFALYRLDGTVLAGSCSIVDARNLIAVGRTAPGLLGSFTDTGAQQGKRYTYLLTTLDRLHNQSRPSPPQWTVR